MTAGDGPINGLVSVIIPFLNAGRFLAEAIDSVTGQTYADWELLLIDDGSTDASSAIAQEYATKHPGRIRYYTHPGGINRGMCTSRNLGLRHSKGEFVAILDADDIWVPRKLEEQVALILAHPQAGMVYGHSEYWHDYLGIRQQVPASRVDVLAPSERLYYPHTLLQATFPLGRFGAPCPSTFFLTRRILEQVGGFEEGFDQYAQFEDQAFLAKIYLSAPVFVSDRCWNRYRVHDASCLSVGKRNGRYESSRRFYLAWLERYLQQRHFQDEAVWRRIRRSGWKYRHPLLYGVYAGVRRPLGRAKRAMFGG